MGMAASQARLLSITARLNHIELQSQNISNAKIRLSDDTQDASDAYVKALNKTQYLYNYYNTSGDTVSQQLTGAALTQYGELKNQYGLINSAGQILVSERDAINYQNSNTLEEFLDKYGVLADIGEGTTIEYVNPVWLDHHSEYEAELERWRAKEPDPANPIYIIPGQVTQENDLYDSFLWATAICYGAAMSYLTNSLGLQGETLTDKDGNNILTYAPGTWTLYKDDKSGDILIDSSTEMGKSCYSHVLSHLLELGSYTTTTGKTINIVSNGSDYGHWWGSDYNNRGGRAAELAAIISENADTVLYACGDIGKDITQSSSDIEKLVSDYYFDENGTLKLKTLQQKIVDLDYANSQGGLSDQQLYDALQHFVNHDLSALSKTEDEFNQELYDKDVAEWESEKPIEDTTIEKYLSKTVRVANDLDEAQWYVNLWNRMNGVSNFKGGFGDNGAYDPDAGWASKSMTEQSWAVLKDGDMNSPEYLKYAIENGLITLEQVQFKDISSNEQGIKNASWVSIVFSNAQDITEVKDETAIAKAEVEYNKVLKEVEIKDKQYDSDLKKLDTEHNALQTEYDSIKTVLEKNVERSFKAFNG